MKYKIVDLMIEFDAKFNMLKSRANKYKLNSKEKTNFHIHLEEEYIKKIKDANPEFTLELAEYIEMGVIFYKKILDYQACLLHSSAVVIDNESYLFSAPCGTGKSTHTSLWLKYLAHKNPYILNDDKPAIRIMENGIYTYGTPFSGKHDISENKKAKLKAICFIEQSKSNSIKKIETREAIKLFFEQTMIDLEEKQMLKFLDILDKILREIPVYKLYCNMSEEAVKLSYNTMKGGNTNEN